MSVADVIIYTQRGDLSKIASEHLKMKGVSSILTPTSDKECTDTLGRFPKALLIVDWMIGPREVVKVLAYNQRKYGSHGRSILLVADKISDQLIATAAEYAVTQIYCDAPTARSLGPRLTNMLLGEQMPDEIKRAMAEMHKAREEGDPGKGLKTLLKLLPKHPSNLLLKCEAAQLLMAKGETDKAFSILETMEKTKPPYLRGIHLLGRCLLHMGKHDEAVAVLEKANLLNPHDADRLCDIGQALLNMDRFKEAAKKFDQVLAGDSMHKAARIGRGQTMLMEAQVNDALALFKDVTGELEMASIFNTCAVMNMRKKRHQEGMNLYESALKVLGQDPKLQSRLYFNMGVGFRRWGKKDRATTCLEKALKLNPNFTKAKAQIEAIKRPSLERGSEAALQEESLPGGGVMPVADFGMALGLEDFSSDLDGLLSGSLDDDDGAPFAGKKKVNDY